MVLIWANGRRNLDNLSNLVEFYQIFIMIKTILTFSLIEKVIPNFDDAITKIEVAVLKLVLRRLKDSDQSLILDYLVEYYHFIIQLY